MLSDRHVHSTANVRQQKRNEQRKKISTHAIVELNRNVAYLKQLMRSHLPVSFASHICCDISSIQVRMTLVVSSIDSHTCCLTCPSSHAHEQITNECIVPITSNRGVIGIHFFSFHCLSHFVLFAAAAATDNNQLFQFNNIDYQKTV